jgi:HEAT repeat protein
MAEAPRVSLTGLRGYISDAGELTKGTQIADGGLLANLARHENRIFGEAKGSGTAPYRVSLVFGEAGELKARCSCMASRSRPFCKHSAALLVAWARSPEAFAVSEAPPAGALEPGAGRKSVKTGKATGGDLMQHGVQRVTTLVRELAVSGVATVGHDRIEQVRQLAEGLRANRLRRLSARTLDMADLLEKGSARRGQVDALAYADLLADMLLTARRLEKHLAGEKLEDRHMEELVGRTWRKGDRVSVEGLDLVEYAFLTRVTSDDYVIRESRFVALATGTHYSEKQILPAFLAKRTEPKRSYAGSVLRGAAGGQYPGFAPHRLELENVGATEALAPSHVERLLEKAHASVGAALAALQEHRRDVFAPDTLPVSVRGDMLVAEKGRLSLVDPAGDAIHLPADPQLDDLLTLAVRQGRLRAVLSDMTIDGILATLTPLAVLVETPPGLALSSLVGTGSDPTLTRPRTASGGGSDGVWLEAARQAGVSAAAIALGEVRLQMAEALVAGLAGLVPRVTDPLVSRLRDLGLEKPASLLGELPGKADPAERIDGFVKVHQVTGLAVVRLASALSVDPGELVRLPSAESIAIRRPSRALAPDELLAARVQGTVSRHEAAWHRATYLESRSHEELLAEWPSFWSDGEAAPFVARTVAAAGDRAAGVACEVLAAATSGQTARVTAVLVLQAVGGKSATSALQTAEADVRMLPAVRARARSALAALPAARGWKSFFSFSGPTRTQLDQAALDALSTAGNKEARHGALEALERNGDDRALPVVRRVWLTDPSQEVRARAARVLGTLGDAESVESLVAAVRDRARSPKEAKGALAALGQMGDVRAVPDILHAVVDNWSGAASADALYSVGMPALGPMISLVLSHPELAQRKVLQGVVSKLASSPEADPILSKRLHEVLGTPDGAEKASALLKLASASHPLRESLARQILARVTAPATKAEKALVRAAQGALEKDAGTA